MPESEDLRIIVTALEVLNRRCPRLVRACYWAGTSCMAAEELHHRHSFDLDFHTRRAMADTRPILAEILDAFEGRFQVLPCAAMWRTRYSAWWSVPRRATWSIFAPR